MDNKELVLKVVEDYINSAYESDGATTRKIFDDDARVTGHINGKLIRQTKEEWATFVEKDKLPGAVPASISTSCESYADNPGTSDRCCSGFLVATADVEKDTLSVVADVGPRTCV